MIENYTKCITENLCVLDNEYLFRIPFNEKTVTAFKGDITRRPKKPAIDLYINLAKILEFPSDGFDFIA